MNWQLGLAVNPKRSISTHCVVSTNMDQTDFVSLTTVMKIMLMLWQSNKFLLAIKETILLEAETKVNFTSTIIKKK